MTSKIASTGSVNRLRVMTNQKPDEVERLAGLDQGQRRDLQEDLIDPMVELGLSPAGSAAHIDRPRVGLFVEGPKDPEFGTVIGHPGETAVIRRVDLDNRDIGVGVRDGEQRS